MAKKDLTVGEKLKQLYTLQNIDTKIDQIQILKGELPMEVSDLEDDIEGLKTRIAKLRETVDKYETERGKHTANIKEAEALIERYDKQLEGVKNNREFDALTKELELQRLEIQLSEKKMRETQIVIDAKNETIAAADSRLESKEADLANKKEELKNIIEKTEKEEDTLNRKSERARKKVEDRLINAYNRLRSAYRNRLAVVTIERDACGGCFNRVPPQTQLEIKSRKTITTCEHCGRILVDDNIMDKTPKS